jgi:hypothetical protein
MQISSKLTVFYHVGVIEPGDASGVATITRSNATAGEDMKIYLLMLIMGTLLTAIHFTSAPQKRSETLPQ